MIYTRGKYFFPAATFKGLQDVSFQTEQKGLQYTLACMSLLCISREETTYSRQKLSGLS